MHRALLIKRLFIASILTLALVYIGDALTFYVHGRHPTSTQPVETLTVPRILAIEHKANKVEYTGDPLQPQETFSCAHTIFPHAGFSPCWRVMKKAHEPIPM